MKITRKVFSGCSSVFLSALLLTGASIVRAAQDADLTPNYGTRALRITNDCDPEVPAPLVTNVDCPTVHPNTNWSFDISWFDPGTQKYYLADRSNDSVDIVDTKTDKVVGVAVEPGAGGPNGVVATNNPHQLWAGYTNSHVVVFRLDAKGLPTSSTPFADVDTGGSARADELAYDPDHHLILVANDEQPDTFLTFISVSSNKNNIKIVGQIKLSEVEDCGIEQPVYDHQTRRFYLAVPCTKSTNPDNHNEVVHSDGEIAVINPNTMKIEKVYALDGTGCFPHGLTLGPRQNLLLGCSADGPAGTPLISLIMRATNGNILATFNQVGGSDEVWYNPGDNHYYLAASNHSIGGCQTDVPPPEGCKGGNPNPVLGIIDAGTDDSGPEGPQWIQNVGTGGGDHSVAAVFAFNCEEGRGFDFFKGHDDGGNGNDRKNCDVVRNRVYVPLRIKTAAVCTELNTDGSCAVTLSTVTTESGGIGVIGRIP
jgi:hypothetical protein